MVFTFQCSMSFILYIKAKFFERECQLLLVCVWYFFTSFSIEMLMFVMYSTLSMVCGMCTLTGMGNEKL